MRLLRERRGDGYSAAMFCSLIRVSTVVLLGALGGGCGLLHFGGARRRAAAEASLAESRRAPLAIGRVSLVNVEGRFALIEATMAQSPGTGTVLRSYTGNAVSSELRVTGVRRRPFLVADLVSGMPVKGDLVVQPKPEAAASPAATPPPTETATPPAIPRWKRWLGLGRVRK